MFRTISRMISRAVADVAVAGRSMACSDFSNRSTPSRERIGPSESSATPLPDYDLLRPHVVILIGHADRNGMLPRTGVQRQLVIQLRRVRNTGHRSHHRPVAAVKRI